MSQSRHLLVVGVLTIAVALSACREEEAGAVKVAKLAFEGNQAFDDGTLRDVIVTEAKGILPWARSRYFNRPVFDADLQRLRAFYIDRGYPSVTVDALDVTFNDRRDEVTIRIGINEGPPRIVERVDLVGTDGLPEPVVQAVRDTLIKTGIPFDRPLAARSKEQATFALKDRGYPDARVDLSEVDGTTADARIVRYTAQPGGTASFGAVSTVGLKAIEPAVVRRTLTFSAGDPYRESQLVESQRRLAALGVFQFAHVVRQQDAGGGENGASAQAVPTSVPVALPANATPITVTVAEAKPTRLRVGVGYGTEDGPRGSFNWQHTNFLGSARRLAIDAKYSLRLSGLGLDLTQPYVMNRWLSVRANAGAWRANDLDYTSRRVGGRLSLEFRRRRSRGLDREPTEHVVRGSYINEQMVYSINQTTLDDLTNFDELIALGFDPVTGSGNGQLTGLALDLERNVVDRVIDPQSGYTLGAHFERAATWLGGTYTFTEMVADVRGYRPVRGTVLAGRVRIGSIRAADDIDVPFNSRYFLGGSASLRGWGRFEVAPLTVDGLPIGGRSMFETAIEARVPLVGKLGFVLFTEAGNVWSDQNHVSFSDLRADVGAGLRYGSPVGIVRADFAQQLTPIAGLVINGAPERRHWRVVFSIGEAF